MPQDDLVWKSLVDARRPLSSEPAFVQSLVPHRGKLIRTLLRPASLLHCTSERILRWFRYEHSYSAVVFFVCEKGKQDAYLEMSGSIYTIFEGVPIACWFSVFHIP